MESWLLKVWEALGVASPLAAMFMFLFLVKAWRDEERARSERVLLEKAKDDLHERTLTGLHDAARQADTLADAVEALATLIRETARDRTW